MSKGIFITFEGGEGAGKTTVLKKLERDLNEEGFQTITTREPGGIELAEQIRSMILDPAGAKMDSRTEALLYAAARRQHLVEKILPALESGKVVLCDRFIDSSLTYQGYARGVGVEEILMINRFAVEGWMPDLTLYFDVSPEVGLARIQKDKDREVNRLDLEKMDFHLRVREGYLQLVRRFPERIHQVDAERTIEEVFADAKKIVDKFLRRARRG